ncbi:hypothetical protein ACFS5L_17605 [Streptomyces phyllanthi]|uniref:hypothetical protein n=1 Tax=Streptomyces phyllanthi TaxID=1803180 RepID=UPI001D155958|nr:hypothetical protein [Streptomyces phyllanthi]
MRAGSTAARPQQRPDVRKPGGERAEPGGRSSNLNQSLLQPESGESRDHRILPAHAPGDHLHFNDEGLKAMADAIDLNDQRFTGGRGAGHNAA